MSSKEKVHMIFRAYADTRDKINAKSKEEGLSSQKVFDTLFGAYLKNNPSIMKLVDKAIVEKGERKKGKLDSTERDELFRLIENEYSPLRDLDKAVQELEEEEDE
jgi:hypothetical protein